MKASAVAKWVRAFAPQMEGWVFKSQIPQTEIEKPGSDSSTAKCLAIDLSVTGPQRVRQTL